ncbi:hypothetical protein BD410DRAFT_893510 [Rickenella mellea]|uniref:Dilute domain-containing protein n=1 Tax=Rickenella mellea TaxID=50990 RepID=A0A4Y7QLH5_9AGAM|nr:hypothetical protein BD410DRAFT_893510 [Rickenella mellea]
MEWDLQPELHPLHPLPSRIVPLLSSDSGLAPVQKSTLVQHCLTRACVFADLSLLHYLLLDPSARPFVELDLQDDDGLVLASTAVLGFGAESERDIEREECVRLLIAEGADVTVADKAGWTPLHYSALLAPPTLISHLLNHGCSPLTVTKRGLTALDVVTAYSVIPGREDVALFLEEAMRGEGWQGTRVAARRRSLDQRRQQNDKQRHVRQRISQMLDLDDEWWKGGETASSSSTSEDELEDENDELYTPPNDYSSMLVFSPASLPRILDSVIANYRPSIRNSDPANALYMLVRFACLNCDDTWLEDLMINATEAIEECFFSHPDDLKGLLFWLYNTTTWLHLLRCDNSVNSTLEILGSFVLIEELINSVFVFVIRYAERRIDKLLDATLLEHSPLSSEFESVQFESEWSFFRSPFSSKRRTGQTPSVSSPSVKSTIPSSPGLPSFRPSSPSPVPSRPPPSTPKAFSSLRQSVTRSRAHSVSTPLQSLFQDSPPEEHTPRELIGFVTALNTLLTDSDINPAFVTQLWSQVMYWTSCEIFNRILTRKKHLCRSRAVQIGMNLSVLEEWVGNVGLPKGVESHFAPVRELLHWLQCLSSMDEFSDLVATIQTMKYLNPLQMRRAVRDYRYEVSEGRMTEDCSQYLVQLQKDWERQRVKLGVEALRKEISDRGRDYDDSISSSLNDTGAADSSFTSQDSSAQRNIDLLFDRTRNKSEWTPAQPPEVLGELLDSRYMLPLLFPSDPRLLSAKAISSGELERETRGNTHLTPPINKEGRSASRASLGFRGSMKWRSRSKQLREVGLEILQRVDGSEAVARWTQQQPNGDNEEEDVDKSGSQSESGSALEFSHPHVHHSVPFTRKPSSRSHTRRTTSNGGDGLSPVTPTEMKYIDTQI